MRILVIAESPAKGYEGRPAILNGCRTGETWRRWADQIGIDPEMCEYHNLYDEHGNLNPKTQNVINEASDDINSLLILLGSRASTHRKRTLGDRNSLFVELPHPSGRNRVLNDKYFVNRILEGAKEYVDQVVSGKNVQKIWSYKK